MTILPEPRYRCVTCRGTGKEPIFGGTCGTCNGTGQSGAKWEAWRSKGPILPMPDPSTKRLVGENAELREKIEILAALIAGLEARVKELEDYD